MVPQQNAAFSTQETHRLNANFTMRSMYNEPHKICPCVVGRLDIVPYIRTFVQYDGTFWRA